MATSMKKYLTLIVIAFSVCGFFIFTEEVQAIHTETHIEGNEAYDDNTAAGPAGQPQSTPSPRSAEDYSMDLLNKGISDDQRAYALAEAQEKFGLTGFRLDIFHLLSGLGAVIMWLGGWLLNMAVYIFTVNMSQVVTYLGLEDSIAVIWAIVRDLFNLLFVFGLIYIGFRTILDADDSGTKRMLGAIVVAALFINFSLYIAQVAVDFSNIVTYQISEMIGVYGETKEVFGITVHDIGYGFANFSNIQELNSSGADLASDLEMDSDGDTYARAVILGLLFLVFYTILGFVFAAGAFLLFARFIALIFLMIFSPLMFIGMVFPAMKNLGQQWRKLFINQLLVAPTFIFMLYISMYSLQAASLEGESFSLLAFMMYLLIVTGFLFASLMVARGLSNWGALQSFNFGDAMIGRLRGYTGGMTSGLAARGLRSTVGKWAHDKAESDDWKDKAANSTWGRLRWNIARKAADSSFDARKVGGVGAKLGLGEGIKGYTTRTKEIEEKEKKFADSLGTVSEKDPRLMRLQTEVDASERMIKDKKAEVQQLRKDLADPTKARNEPERRNLRAKIEAARAEIEDQEEKKKEHTENLDREKHRRQLGTVAPTGPSALAAEDVRLKKEDVKDLLRDYVSKTGADKEKQAEYIAEAKKELADLEKKANQASGGYATTLENIGAVKNFFIGHTKAANDNAAKKIRDEYKKKIKSADKDK